MALIACQECRAQISDRAASCPRCGCPVDAPAAAPPPRPAPPPLPVPPARRGPAPRPAARPRPARGRRWLLLGCGGCLAVPMLGLLIVFGGCALNQWGPGSGRRPDVVLTGLPHPVKDIAFSQDGTLIVAATFGDGAGGAFAAPKESGMVAVWDAVSGTNRFSQPVDLPTGKYFINRVLFDANPDRVWVGISRPALLGDGNETVALDWRAPAWKFVGNGKVEAVLPAGKNLLVNHGSRATVRAAEGFAEVRGVPAPPDTFVERVMVDPAGEQMVVHYHDTRQTRDSLHRYAVATGQPQGTFDLGRGTSVRGLEFTQDGRLVLVTSSDQVSVWDRGRAAPEARFSVRTVSDGTGRARFCLLPDGRRFAILAPSDRVQLWDLDSGAEGERLNLGPGDKRLPTCLAVSPRGDRLAAGCLSGEVVVWQLK